MAVISESKMEGVISETKVDSCDQLGWARILLSARLK
jgi:hypothetical protein